VTKLSTWSSEPAYELIGCGVDAERVDRLQRLVGEPHPWPMVFSPSEITHSRSLPHPARGLCASFCCKEATFKAIKDPINFTDCQLLFEPGSSLQTLQLSAKLRQRYGITRASVWILAPDESEMLAVVYLFRGRRT